ncbi:Glutathione synthetase [hydrothermal vent metagenome]|uniref:Glutathione synthetase n=1 Tax=hydrothermal vent metagenome TaxID=652676 RepID=A0A3B1D564_9ZZZZ
MNVVFLMDPLKTVIMEKDTSFILMYGAHQKKHTIYFLPSGGITRCNGKTQFHVAHVIPQKIKEQPFIIKQEKILFEDDVDIIFIRTDPPFNDEYLLNTWILDLLPERIKIINAPQGIRTVNEKIWATQFVDLLPPTLVGRNQQDMLDFIAKEKEIVAKPTDGFGGKSIFHLKENDANLNVVLETLTQDGYKDIILQKFIPESRIGDKRILLLNGEPLGAVLRVHGKDDHRNNFFAGGKAEKIEITQRDHEIINVLKPHLQKLGLYFVGIDVMGDYLIEVNVTSPTCLQEMNTLYNKQLEDEVIKFMEELCKI